MDGLQVHRPRKGYAFCWEVGPQLPSQKHHCWFITRTFNSTPIQFP